MVQTPLVLGLDLGTDEDRYGEGISSVTTDQKPIFTCLVILEKGKIWGKKVPSQEMHNRKM